MKNSTQKYQRIFLIVTDSLGIGEDPRAAEFGDEGANTFYHVSQTQLLEIPTLLSLGITSIAKLDKHYKLKNQKAYTTRAHIQSNAKDTLAGHWEMMGLLTSNPLPSFPNEIDQELLKSLELALGREIVGRKACSGIEAIEKFAHEEIHNKKIIVYSSQDSTIQICGHEEHTGLETLYDWCKKARQVCDQNLAWKVGRVIARPYITQNDAYVRTANRHDYVLDLPGPTMLDKLKTKGVHISAIGKISDIFNKQGICESFPSTSDDHGMDTTIEIAMQQHHKQHLIFTNLVDFDSKYGHRRDAEGYALNINRFDIKLAKLINAIQKNDLVIVTSDHGNDPKMPGWNHTRELVPVLIYSKNFKERAKRLVDLKSIATIGNFVGSNFGVDKMEIGEDIFDQVL